MTALSAADRRRLIEVFAEARVRRALGPAPVERHVAHAEALSAVVGRPPHRFLDLGSGAGVPGLVWLLAWPGTHAVLLEVRARRVRWLEEAAERLRVSERCTVLRGRAESLAHEEGLRERFELVVARAFGSPAVTAECATGFLARRGRLVVSEPPGGTSTEERWPPGELAVLGLGPPTVTRTETAAAAVMVKETSVAREWPRRAGTPAKRPLW